MTVERVDGATILVVEARYHSHINDMLIEGALRVIEEAGAKAELVTVPGALEIPPAIARAEAAGGFDAYVALGCVIRGETTHYELVSEESCRGLMDLGVRGRLAIGNGILTTENEQQAVVRADPKDQNKGGGAAAAAIALLALTRRLSGAPK
ncbi:6,7-dimethyl-8-ribityllumazine synthase [Arboricoccus pini]|uniref:6,7-dimethyl-8-ribityllumazine synthase n=1 Tax=Arboricoccus pini TaxID=1963835 RepID=UPI001FAFC0A6|nr:6,7-dimethyl-8-ribityllumazine synthase [Arboricoccus pini]